MTVIVSKGEQIALVIGLILLVIILAASAQYFGAH